MPNAHFSSDFSQLNAQHQTFGLKANINAIIVFIYTDIGCSKQFFHAIYFQSVGSRTNLYYNKLSRSHFRKFHEITWQSDFLSFGLGVCLCASVCCGLGSFSFTNSTTGKKLVWPAYTLCVYHSIIYCILRAK